MDAPPAPLATDPPARFRNAISPTPPSQFTRVVKHNLTGRTNIEGFRAALTNRPELWPSKEIGRNCVRAKKHDPMAGHRVAKPCWLAARRHACKPGPGATAELGGMMICRHFLAHSPSRCLRRRPQWHSGGLCVDGSVGRRASGGSGADHDDRKAGCPASRQQPDRQIPTSPRQPSSPANPTAVLRENPAHHRPPSVEPAKPDGPSEPRALLWRHHPDGHPPGQRSEVARRHPGHPLITSAPRSINTPSGPVTGA
jgi:hypothetical protein